MEQHGESGWRTGPRTSFSRAVFHHRVYFRATTFGHFADFGNANFGDLARFECATFGNGELFGSGGYPGEAIFTGAIFSAADFSGVTFNPHAVFDDVTFRVTVDFSGLSHDLFADKLEECLGPADNNSARDELVRRHRNSWKQHGYGCGPDRFLTISFANARFGVDADAKGAAIFSGRSFEYIADFTGAQFY